MIKRFKIKFYLFGLCTRQGDCGLGQPRVHRPVVMTGGTVTGEIVSRKVINIKIISEDENTFQNISRGL
jgi:hypothetical protein